MSSFGQRLKASIKRHGMTQRAFALKVGAFDENVSRWCHDVYEPGRESLKAILVALPHVDARWLICGEPPRLPVDEEGT